MSATAFQWHACVRSATVILALAGPAFAQAREVEISPGNEVVASVGSHDIRRQDLERHWREQDPAGFARVRQQLYEGEKRALDSLIGTYLLQQEATKQQMSVAQLLAQLRESAEAPTKAEVQEVFDRSPASTQGVTLDLASPMIAGYLRQQKGEDARRRFVEQLKRSAGVDVRIPLESLRQTVAIDPTDPSRGPRSAPVEIVEFSDFECPYCKRATPVLKQVLAKYPDQVRLVWKDFPLPMHPTARPAAEAAQCANEQGRFWEYHDVLFRNQDALTDADLREYAAQVGLDVPIFNDCVGATRHRAKVSAGVQEGTRLGISATPTVFINGRMVTGAVPFEAYEQLIREELSALPSPGAKQ